MTLTKSFYTEKEVAELFGISRHTLMTWRSRPTENCPAFTKVGRSVRYQAKELQKWIDRNTQK